MNMRRVADRGGIVKLLVTTIPIGAFLGGLTVLALGREKTSPERAQSRAVSHRTPSLAVPALPEERKPAERGTAVALRTDAAPSPEAPNDPQRLREWLLAMADHELAQIVGTDVLDRYVAQIFLQGLRSNDESGRNGADQFLGQLNERILAVRQAKNSLLSRERSSR